MKDKKKTWFFSMNLKIFMGIAIAASLPLVYFFVYSTGGIKYVYSHTMYIPIILAGLFFGPWAGLLTAIVGGILLGPLMPIDVLTGETQLLINWLYRLLVFIIVGFISGFFAMKMRKNTEIIEDLMSHNQETLIPNTNYLKRTHNILEEGPKTIITILINNHNNIIDVLGKEVYQKFLYRVYQDLKNELPKNTLIVQSDSNKFWIIKEYVDLKEDAEKVVGIITKARAIDNVPLYVEYSVGVNEISDHLECNSFATFTNSDISARQAQLSGLAYSVYDYSKQQKKMEYELLMSFRQALENDETYLVFQPKIDLKTLKPCGLEALIRWHHPVKGTIYPGIFIPLIEQTRLINDLTNWVLKKTLLKIKEFEKKGIKVTISMNVSPKNLLDPEFFERSIKMIEAADIPSDTLQFEITESTVMQNPEESRIALVKFAEKGIQIAIDDFGTGHSSLSYLSRFPINTIKIDQFFMKQIVLSESIKRIVKATIQLAKELGYHVLAEGIEEEEVLNIVKAYDCDFAQGYYYARPIDDDKIINWYTDEMSK